MRTTHMTLGAFALLIATAVPAMADGNQCNWENHGIIVNVGNMSGNSCDWSDDDSSSSTMYFQYCSQGTGAGAGAIESGVNGSDPGDAGAGAGASTECTQGTNST